MTLADGAEPDDKQFHASASTVTGLLLVARDLVTLKFRFA